VFFVRIKQAVTKSFKQEEWIKAADHRASVGVEIDYELHLI
jgi:hypothetical protein